MTENKENDGIEKNQLKLESIFSEIKKLDPNTPAGVNRLIKLHIKVQFIMAKIEEQALINEGEAYLERKRVQADVALSLKGTGVEKEATAELAITDLRRKETQARALVRGYMRQFEAVGNTIIAYRFDEKILYEEYMKTNDIENR